VADEITAGADELTDWMRHHASEMFLDTDSRTAERFSQVSAWVTGQAYEPAAINTFLQVADFYLVAQALAGNHVVVTHEIPSNSKRKVKIPDACIGLSLRFMTPYEMLRIEQARFILGGSG
jgi:hypothetical protein